MRMQSTHLDVNINDVLAISKCDCDNSGEAGPQAKAVNHKRARLCSNL